MVQFECPKLSHLLKFFTFGCLHLPIFSSWGDIYLCPFSVHGGISSFALFQFMREVKGRKIWETLSLVGCKRSSLIAPNSVTCLSFSHLYIHLNPFSFQEGSKKWKKQSHWAWGANGPFRIPQTRLLGEVFHIWISTFTHFSSWVK